MKTESQVKKQANLHDRFFKRFYSEPDFAIELCKLALSETEFAACDWSTLKAEKDSLKDKQADLVFTVSLKKRKNAKILICLLLEHKSAYDKRVFQQNLSYQTLLYERKFEHIVAVIPILFYHGKIPWKWPVSFQKGFFGKFFKEIPPAFRKSMLDFKMKVVDTNDPKVRKAFQDPQVKSRGALALLSKIWNVKQSVSELSSLVEAFAEFSEKREDLLLSVVSYLKTAGGVSAKLWQQVENKAIQSGLLTRGGYMDIREEIREDGIQEGLQAGRQEGLQTGMRQVALNMLKNRLDIPLISKVTGLSEDQINKLKHDS